MLVAFAYIFVRNVKIRLFCHRDAGMPQYFAQGVNVHSVHQTAFRKVIPQTMRGIILTQSGPINIFLEIAFKITHADRAAVFFHREQIIAFHIAVFVLEPSADSLFRFGGEVNCPLPPPFGFLCPQVNFPSVQVNVRYEQSRTLPPPHTAVQH